MEIKNIIKEEVNRFLNESVSLWIKDAEGLDEPEDILDLSSELWRRIGHEIIVKQATPFEMNRYKDEGLYGEQIAPDGGDAFNTEGTINFYLKGIPERLIQPSLEGIKKILTEKGVKFGQFSKPEESGAYKSQVIRIPVLGMNVSENQPPEFNMSNFSFLNFMRKVLKYDDPDYSGLIPVSELAMRINRAKDNLNKFPSSTAYGGLRKTGDNVFSGPTEYGQDYYNQIIKSFETLIQYAIQNGYDTIAYG